MKKILAVSGGVDSMVMLDLALKTFPGEEIVVATFDHGTRESSGLDAEFVARKALELSEVLPSLKTKVYRGRAELGPKISEEKARAERYKFLREVAFEEKGEIFTAHHLDDLVETVVINFIRGTGIRGLAPFSGFGIRRPFLDGSFGKVFDRREVLKYASENGISFRLDPTNSSDDYLRNRVRERTFNLSLETKLEIFRLSSEQKKTVREIDAILESIIPEDLRFSRGDFREIDEEVSLEVLRAGLIRAGVSTTEPQRKKFLEAILSYQPGKKFNLPNDKLIRINKNDFML